MSTLRSATIRLAYANPNLRPHLLPLLTGKQAAEDEDKVRAVNNDGKVVWVNKDTLRDKPGEFKPYKHEEDTGKGGGAEHAKDWTTWGVPKLEHEIAKINELHEEVSTLNNPAEDAKALRDAVLKKMNRETLPPNPKDIDFSESWSVINKKRTEVNKALESRGLTERVPRIQFEPLANGVRVTVEGKKGGKEFTSSKDLFDALASDKSPLNIEDDAIEALGALEEVTGKYESELKKKQDKGKEKKASLRSGLIRLAHANPNLRPHLLPLLAATGARVAVRKWKDKEKMEAYLADHPGANPDNHEVVGGDGEGDEQEVVYKKPTKEQVERAKREAPKTKWKKPDLGEEQGEVERTALALGIENYEDIMAAGKKAKLEPLDDEVWGELENTDSYNTDTVGKANGRAKKYNRDIANVFDGMGGELPAPVVLFREGEPPYLVGGNTRLMASRALGHTPKVLAIRL